jgi:hypothetical protein
VEGGSRGGGLEAVGGTLPVRLGQVNEQTRCDNEHDNTQRQTAVIGRPTGASRHSPSPMLSLHLSLRRFTASDRVASRATVPTRRPQRCLAFPGALSSLPEASPCPLLLYRWFCYTGIAARRGVAGELTEEGPPGVPLSAQRKASRRTASTFGALPPTARPSSSAMRFETFR